jgi:hypothetical protein
MGLFIIPLFEHCAADPDRIISLHMQKPLKLAILH